VEPKEHFINWQQDPFGNYLARLVFPKKIKRLSVEVDLIAEVTIINPFDFFVEDYAQDFPFTYEERLAKELTPYLEIKEWGPLLMEWLYVVDHRPQKINDFLVSLNRRVQRDIHYTIRMEPGVQPCDVTLEKASGSCRDSAWLLTQILRHLGLAARFVSGYLIQLTPDVKSLDGPSGTTHDFTDLHAWTEVYVPGAGWLGLDPTSGLFAGEGHIPLACTPDPMNAAPISGNTDKCEVAFHFHNKIQRIHEDPRVTKPYTEQQWQTIEALGHKIDDDLINQDVRLTMGGEPTFVSIDDMDGAEWNTEALGPTKYKLSDNLLRRLCQRFAQGAVLHHGQGKWYPGEPLPRWALSCFWRKDGVPVWRDPQLIADSNKNYGYTVEQAERFIQQLARRLAIKHNYIVPAYEDTLYYLWKEGNLPVNINPLRANLKDDSERQRIARLLSQGLNNPAGYALPLRWNLEQTPSNLPIIEGGTPSPWSSCPWKFRRDTMYLLPGDSPMGFRLPLESLPWVAKEKREILIERDLFEEKPTLSDTYHEVVKRYQWFDTSLLASSEPTPNGGPVLQSQTGGTRKPAFEDVYTDVVRTALCVEARNGFLYIFLPPFTILEHYLDLIANIELVAKDLELSVLIEGYEPPFDERLLHLSITPDPGVIEVNIHPSHRWDELVKNTTILYEEAHYARLGTEKFMVDGRHTGTGGGNHVTIGGITPADSPILRRPDLLQSMVTYWQHHPSLSYLFSGLFVGPTSQAPRVDEARDENLYELEIAFQRLPQGESPSPWIVDRVLRNLLVDITGNTHRAEFCIDKLYSPDSASGRRGLVEMRAFEMPPHARMSLMQILLLRGLIARFWKKPYNFPLVRWGTELHDQFLLPHYNRQDIKGVIEELQTAGYPFQMEWLDPFFEFRFPHYGTVKVGDIQLDLNMAIEPWHVLGEEVAAMGTTRYVDSSVERLQIKVTGITDSRYVIACNGRRVPLRNTGVQGEYVAGIRYKAWQPASALHPTIPVDVPLVFDIVDTWNGRAIGGCTYYVSHPGGLSHDDFPVNAYAAEGRRIARFNDFGHTPGIIRPPPEFQSLAGFYPEGHPVGPMQPPPEDPLPEYPHTLDLRRLRR
jgi:uncharacterized protein (DUF2126 family)